jgi:hypothetical protein
MIPLVRPFYQVFETIPDQRGAKGKRHPLVGVLCVVVLALIDQQNSLRQIAARAAGLDWQARQRLPLRYNPVPSEATIRRALHELPVQAVTRAVQAWVEEILAAYFPNVDWQGMTIDGKTVRGSRDVDADVPALQVLNVMVHKLGVFIQGQAVSVGTNELGTIHD